MSAGPSFRELIPTHASSLLAAVCLVAALVITMLDPRPRNDEVVEQAPPMINVGEVGVNVEDDFASFSLDETAGCRVGESIAELVCADTQVPEASTTDVEPAAGPDAT